MKKNQFFNNPLFKDIVFKSNFKCSNIKNGIKSKKKLKKKICENLILVDHPPKIFDYCLFPKEKINLKKWNLHKDINMDNYNYVLFLFINIPYVVYLIPKFTDRPIIKFTFEMNGEYGEIMKKINGYANSLIKFKKKFKPNASFVREVFDTFIVNYEFNEKDSIFYVFHPKLVKSIKDLCEGSCDLIIFDFDSQKIDGHCLVMFHFTNDMIKIIKI
jgi:hypothetical protein